MTLSSLTPPQRLGSGRVRLSRTTTPLNGGALLRARGDVAVPTYDRRALRPSVVHISVGGFTRAHQLLYFDEIAQRRISDHWGVRGIGLHSRALKDALAPQDYLYLLVEQGAEHEHARVIGSLIGYHFAPEEPGATLAALCDRRTQLVTLTITGTAYRIDPQTGEFDADDAEVQADLRHPGRPGGALGLLVEALDRRRRAGLPPLTVLSCDNLQDNGRAARTAVLGFARIRDEVLARWIADNVAFPSSMVDRIVPQTTTAHRAAVAAAFGVDDRWPVVTEPFRQWIVQDDFGSGRPPLDQVGARFVSDVGPYQLIKTRLVNGGHCALGYLGQLAGYTHTHEVLADPVLHDYATRLLDEEVSPLLPLIEGVDLADYTKTVLTRFANPAIADRLERLCGRGSTKMPSYLLPSLHEAARANRPHELLALAVAAWCQYLRRVDAAGKPIEIHDDRGPELQGLAIAGGLDPRPLLAERSVFHDLGQHPSVVDAVARALRGFERDGVRATVAAFTNSPFPRTTGATSGASA